MLPVLDLRTITFISSVYCLVFGIGLLFIARKTPNHRGLYTAAIADLFITGSMLAIFFRGHLNTEISIQLTNALIHIALIVSHRALVLFRKSEAKKIFYIAYLLLVAQLTAIIYFTYYKPDLQMRIIVMSMAISTQFMLMAYSLYYSDIKSQTTSQRLLNHATVIFAVIFLFRAIATSYEPQPDSFLDAGYLHTLSISSILIFVILKDFGMFISILEKTMIELIASARTDMLTNLYNRRGLSEIAGRELNKLLRHVQPLTLVICDLDDFKKINDSYGHSMGDRALQTFAKILRSNTRDIDICARLGGDEFVLIFPSTSIDQTAIIINKIKKRLAVTFVDNNKNVTLSASFGIANYKDGVDLETMLNVADKALYEAKRTKSAINNVTNITQISSAQ